MSSRNISAAEIRQITRVCERLHCTCSKEDFTNHLYVVLNKFLPSIHFTIDHFTLAPLTHQSALNESLPEITFQQFRHFMHQHPGLIKNEDSDQNIGSLLTAFKPAHYQQTELYNEVYRSVGIEDQVWMGVGNKEELIGISYSSDAIYTNHDLLQLSLLQPQIRIAWKNWKRIVSLEDQLQQLKTTTAESEQRAQQHATMQTAIQSLTPRQREVVEQVSLGKTNQEIADELHISPRTVGKHLEQIFAVVDVRTRTALASRSES